jgi:hypothetical protein
MKTEVGAKICLYPLPTTLVGLLVERALGEIEHKIDENYLKTKKLFVKYG